MNGEIRERRGITNHAHPRCRAARPGRSSSAGCRVGEFAGKGKLVERHARRLPEAQPALRITAVSPIYNLNPHEKLHASLRSIEMVRDQNRGESHPEPTGYRNMKTAPPRSIDEHIAGFPRDVQETLQRIRGIIRKAAPDAEETINYGIPTFVLHGNLVHFAGFQKHIGFYPTPSAIEKFKDDLSPYKTAKGSVQFPLDQPTPFSLIRKIVEFRVKETREKLATKKRKK